MMPRQEHADLLRREEAARLRVVVDERDRPLAELAGGPRETVRVGAVHAKADDDVAVSQSLRLQRTKVRRDAVPALVCTRQEAPPVRRRSVSRAGSYMAACVRPREPPLPWPMWIV